MIALTPWVAALVTISIWPATLLSAVGPDDSELGRVLELLRGFLGAVMGLVEDRVAHELRQQNHADVRDRVLP